MTSLSFSKIRKGQKKFFKTVISTNDIDAFSKALAQVRQDALPAVEGRIRGAHQRGKEEEELAVLSHRR